MGYTQLYEGHYTKGARQAGQAGSSYGTNLLANMGGTGVIWSLRYPERTVQPSANKNDQVLMVQRIAMEAAVITILGTPAAGRRLALFRATAPQGTANPSGGTAFTMVRKRSDSVERLAVGHFSSSASLTTTGFTIETDPIRTAILNALTAVDSMVFNEWLFDGNQADPIFLLPGQALFLVVAGGAIASTGNWVLNVDSDAVEVP